MGFERFNNKTSPKIFPVTCLVHVRSLVQIFLQDTVNSLSRPYGSTVQQIKDWNSLDDNYTIYVGQVLRVK
ncbi:LysM domain-containing protein [Fictibacillus sp. UD]